MLLLSSIFCCISLFGVVEESVLPKMDQLVITDLQGKMHPYQAEQMLAVKPDEKLRVVSFNMLLNWSESHLEMEDRWEQRKARVIKYVRECNADIIGTQELQPDQLDELMAEVGDTYAYYGARKRNNDIEAILYRADRFQLQQGRSGAYTCVQFKDLVTEQEFVAINTHLAFGNIEKRHAQAEHLRAFVSKTALPVILTGDFNTFPMRQELDLPFYDGDRVVQIIEQGGVVDARTQAIFGHFGPISSTNFCNETKKPFMCLGTPGVILDHIFVSADVRVLAHAIDPAKIDGRYPSDHFPVIVDLTIGN